MKILSKTPWKQLLPLILGVLTSGAIFFPGLIKQAKTPLPMVILTEGLFLVGLSVLFIYLIYLVKISQFKIRQLQKTNQQLQREIHQRQQTEIALNQLAAIV